MRKSKADIHRNRLSDKARRRRFPWLLILPALTLAALAFLLLPRGRRAATANPKSSVLLITLDTTRADRLGYAGHAAARTPNLDRLARQSVRCDTAYSPVPLTLPAHCTVLSGFYPPAHQVRNNGNYFLPAPVVTLAEVLGARGYETAAFVSSFVLDSRFGLDQGFAVYDDDLAVGTKTYHSERDAAAVFTAFNRWLAGSRGGPFFAWVHFFDPHAPYAPPEPYAGGLADPYDGEIAYMDHYVGEVISRLEEKGLAKNTLVVIAGDHGEAFGEHGEFGHQVFCYEENLRVPLLFRADGFLPPGMRLKQPASLVDIMPTVLDFLGLPLPPKLQGRSLLPAMRGKELPAADVYVESLFASEAFQCAPVLGIIRGGHKFLDLPRPELYDLERDPGERENIVSRSAARGRELKAGLRDLARRLDGGAVASRRQLSESEKATLASLGYIASGPAAPAGGPLPDPKDKIAGWQVFNLGAEQAASGQSEAAAASLRRAIEILPFYAGSYTLLANVYFKSGRHDAALELLKSAMERIPGDATLKTEYATLLVRMGRSDQAMAQLRELARLDLVDKRAYVRAQMAAVCESRGQDEEAIGHYRRAMELDPENSDYARKLAYLLHRGNRFAEALEVYRALERRLPEDIQLIRDMAIVYAQLNDLERSRAYFAKALQRAPDANLYFNYALLLARRGETAEAAAAMEKFLALAPAGSAQAEAGRRHLAAWRKH